MHAINKYPILTIIFIITMGIIESSILTSILKYCDKPYMNILAQIGLILLAVVTIGLCYMTTYKVIIKIGKKNG